MVRTGARAAALSDLLERSGLPPTPRPPAPRLSDLDEQTTNLILQLYRDLGGVAEQPTLRPGAWDLCAGGILVELDEELHFNRYRRVTLEPGWAASLPWRDAYLRLCGTREAACLKAATWGKRWTSPSSERLFGGSADPGDLDARLGAPRWKQRALYDAVKDVAALTTGVRLARLSVFDEVASQPLGAVLEGRADVDPAALVSLVAERTV